MIELERRDAAPAPRALPIVAVCGRWGKTTTIRLLEAMLYEAPADRPRLALWTDGGVYIDGRRQLGELLPWGEALRSLAAGELDLAIQELDARTVNAVGLPEATYALGIITSFCGNDPVCLVGPRAAGERQAQLAVARAVHPGGALVLNADDHAVADEAIACSGEAIFYGASRRNPFIRARLAAGGKAVCISGGMIVLCEGRRSRPVLPVRDVAISLGGAIVFQVHNALAAVAAAWQLGVPPARIASALRAFRSGPTLMPGACNQFQIGGATVIVDRLHDSLSARALMRGVRKVAGRRRRVVLLPADPRLDEAEGAEIGRLTGRSFDLVLLHDPGREGLGEGHAERRAEGAVEKALRGGIAATPRPPITLMVPDEGVGLERLLGLLNPNDLALILASDLSLVLRGVLIHRPLAVQGHPPDPSVANQAR